MTSTLDDLTRALGMGSSENEKLDLSDGRTLSYAVYGSPMPRTTLIYMHGFPSARFEGKLWHSACASRGVRIIVPDRPGSGLSTFQKKRTFLDWPKDVVELADQLKINQFYIAGVSGGSPYALACIHALPKERILGAVVCSGIYPLKLGTEGMMLMNRMLFWSAPWSPRFTAFLFEQFMGRFARSKTDPLRFTAMAEKDLQSRFHRDRDVLLDGRVFPIFVDMSREAVRQGCEGQGWEASLYGSEWGFELGQLLVGEDGVPLTIWHGTEDPNVSVKMAKRAKDLMPGSVLRLMHGEGHMSYVLRDADKILDALLGTEDSENFVNIGEETN